MYHPSKSCFRRTVCWMESTNRSLELAGEKKNTSLKIPVFCNNPVNGTYHVWNESSMKRSWLLFFFRTISSPCRCFLLSSWDAPSQPFQWFRPWPSSLKVFWPTERYLLSKSKPETEGCKQWMSSLYITNKQMRCESPSKIKWDLTNGPLSKLVRSVGPVGDFLENQQSLNVMFQNLLWRQYGKFFEKTGSSLIKHGKYNCQKDWQSK